MEHGTPYLPFVQLLLVSVSTNNWKPRGPFFGGSKIPRLTRRSRMIVISQSGAHAIALFCCESIESLPQ